MSRDLSETGGAPHLCCARKPCSWLAAWLVDSRAALSLGGASGWNLHVNYWIDCFRYVSCEPYLQSPVLPSALLECFWFLRCKSRCVHDGSWFTTHCCLHCQNVCFKCPKGRSGPRNIILSGMCDKRFHMQQCCRDPNVHWHHVQILVVPKLV